MGETRLDALRAELLQSAKLGETRGATRWRIASWCAVFFSASLATAASPAWVPKGKMTHARKPGTRNRGATEMATKKKTKRKVAKKTAKRSPKKRKKAKGAAKKSVKRAKRSPKKKKKAARKTAKKRKTR